MLTTYKTTLAKKIQLTADVFLFCFHLIDPAEINFLAGQYLILPVPAKNLSRLYSIASPNTIKDSFELLVKIVPGGVGSNYLANLKIGDEVMFQGSVGVFTLKESPRDKVFLVTGTGYAPIRSMIMSMINSEFRMQNLKLKTSTDKSQISNIQPPTPNIQYPISNIYLFAGFRYYQDVFLFDELKNLYQPLITNLEFRIKNLELKPPTTNHQPLITICLSREKNLEMIPPKNREYFFLGHITDAFEKLILPPTNHQPPITNFDFYLCSSSSIVESLRQYLEEKGAPKEQVFFERF